MHFGQRISDVEVRSDATGTCWYASSPTRSWDAAYVTLAEATTLSVDTSGINMFDPETENRI